MKVKKSTELRTLECEACSTPFTQTSPRQRYCQPKCRMSNYIRLDKQVITCKGCGEEVLNPAPAQKYCTLDCKLEAAKTPLVLTNCLECKKEFMQAHWHQKYCSNTCKNSFNNRKNFRVPTSLTPAQRKIVKDLIKTFKTDSVEDEDGARS